MKPRVLFVSRRVQLPPSESERRRWDAIRDVLEFRAVEKKLLDLLYAPAA